jgi:hypothetical protein
LYIADGEGEVLIFACGKEKNLLRTIEGDSMISANPIFANGTLYLTTARTLLAIREKK